MLPLLSRMLSEGWGAPGVLYLCPIKALLNDLEPRLKRLTGLFGRRTGVWHGDVATSARCRMTRDAPDVLLATPESVEVMLVSRLVDHRRFFAGLRAVVVDEIHALAGDDRGWHLLALLERLQRLAGAPVQRIGLSATLANAPGLLHWLTAGRDEPGQVVAGAAAGVAEVDVQVDFVGKLSNAALVIARLHAGEKRLVFCDSRSQVEALASELRLLGVRTYASHSSLSRDQRLQAEAAFAQGTDCVIVATRTLELGIDVGDLDRVIQVDAPHSVASLGLGEEGRALYGARNYLELFSAFLSPPLFTGLSWQRRAGAGARAHLPGPRGRAGAPVAGAANLAGAARGLERPPRVRGAGRAPRAVAVAGKRPAHTLRVGPGGPGGAPAGRGRAVPVRRAGEKLGELREEHAWLSDAATTLRVGEPEGESRWWTFAGDLYNAAAVAELTRRGVPAASDALALTLRSDAATLPETVADAARAVAANPLRLPVPADGLHLKFIECVPTSLRAAVAARRIAPGDAAVRAGAAPLTTRTAR
jgi:hypothetical protein